MVDERKPLSCLPGGLLVAGVMFLLAGFFAGGPDLVGGIMFGVVSLAAAGAILHRRARDARLKADPPGASRIEAEPERPQGSDADPR